MKKRLEPWQDRVLFFIFMTAFAIFVICAFVPPLVVLIVRDWIRNVIRSPRVRRL
jgi:hypothetical protein